MFRSLVVLALVSACGCGGADSASKSTPAIPAAPAADATVAVATVTPKRQTLNWTIDQPGAVFAFETTPIVAKLPGYVTKVNVDLGDVVVKDQVLAEVSIPELVQEKKQKDAAVDQAKAEVTQAERNADVAKEHIVSAEALENEAKAGLARLDADVERWASELKRVEGLVAGKIIDTQTLDETRKQHRSVVAAKGEAMARVSSTTAMVGESKAKKGRAEADILAAKAKQAVAEAEVGRVAEMLAYTKVRAPYAGVVTSRTVNTGHLLQPSSGRLESLFTLAKLDTVRVFVEVPEASAAVAVPKAAAVVRVPSLKNREFSGTITRTAGVLNGESRTLKVEIDLPNPDGLLMPGTYVTVKIAATTREALTVPAAAVLFADETAYCYLVEQGRAVKTRVQVGRVEPGQIEVLGKRRAGMTTGEWQPFTGTEKVVNGKLGELADGQPVGEK